MAHELMAMSAVEQAAAVRAGDVSAAELVDAALAEIERLNGDLNAVVTVVDERARTEASAIAPRDDRPLAGVPIVVKDLLQLTEGVRTTFGTRASGEFVPHKDTTLVAKLRAAGAIVVGKTSTPEFGILPTTEPARFGPTRNPWDRSRTAGGSSGGTAAAVAAGMVAFGHGNDGGGSIRIPASCCGLVGLKPSRGRISMAPLVPGPAMLAIDGFLTWTVADTALGLDLGAGYELGDVVSPPPPAAPFSDAVEREPGPLRIGFTTDAPSGVEVDPECVAALEEAVELLESLGHEVENSAPRWELDGLVDVFLAVWSAEQGAGIEALGALLGHQVDLDLVEPLAREMHQAARSMTAVDVLHALTLLRAHSRRIVRWWDHHDVLVTPTLAKPPQPLGWLDPAPGEPALQMMRNAVDFTPFTALANATGQPAISLPLHQSGDGLPIGVQLMGAPAGEELLLSLAGQLERAAPWLDRRPEVATA
jgi:amidase